RGPHRHVAPADARRCRRSRCAGDVRRLPPAARGHRRAHAFLLVERPGVSRCAGTLPGSGASMACERTRPDGASDSRHAALAVAHERVAGLRPMAPGGDRVNDALFQRASQTAPGGVHSPVRAFKGVGATPVFMASAEGAWLTDVEGRTYIDFCQIFGPLMLWP